MQESPSSSGAFWTPSRARVASNDQSGIKRGLIHGAILSLAIWSIAGYLTFVLH